MAPEIFPDDILLDYLLDQPSILYYKFFWLIPYKGNLNDLFLSLLDSRSYIIFSSSSLNPFYIFVLTIFFMIGNFKTNPVMAYLYCFFQS